MARTILRRGPEVLTGTVVATTLTNTTFDIELGPGFWRIALFINANGVSAGTLAVTVKLPDGTFSESDAPEAIYLYAGNATPSATLALTDFIGSVELNNTTGGTSVPTGAGSYSVAVYSTVRLTIASIAGASATNRIDYIAQRV